MEAPIERRTVASVGWRSVRRRVALPGRWVTSGAGPAIGDVHYPTRTRAAHRPCSASEAVPAHGSAARQAAHPLRVVRCCRRSVPTPTRTETRKDRPGSNTRVCQARWSPPVKQVRRLTSIAARSRGFPRGASPTASRRSGTITRIERPLSSFPTAATTFDSRHSDPSPEEERTCFRVCEGRTRLGVTIACRVT